MIVGLNIGAITFEAYPALNSRKLLGFAFESFAEKADRLFQPAGVAHLVVRVWETVYPAV